MEPNKSLSIAFQENVLHFNTIRIKSSENKQQPGVSRSGHSQWEEAGIYCGNVGKFPHFFSIEGFPFIHFGVLHNT